jgi:hypothetical protein
MDVTFNNIANKNVSTDLAQPEIVSAAPFWYETPQNLLSRIWKHEELHEIDQICEISVGAGWTIPDVKAGAKVQRTKKIIQNFIQMENITTTTEAPPPRQSMKLAGAPAFGGMSRNPALPTSKSTPACGPTTSSPSF